MANATTEKNVENYLVKVTRAFGGDTRKLRWVGRRHAPDRMILFPKTDTTPGFFFMVEVKRPDKSWKMQPGQIREMSFLSFCNVPVVPPVYTKECVDKLFHDLVSRGILTKLEDRLELARQAAENGELEVI